MKYIKNLPRESWSGRSLGALVEARAFGMTPLEVGRKSSEVRDPNFGLV